MDPGVVLGVPERSREVLGGFQEGPGGSREGQEGSREGQEGVQEGPRRHPRGVVQEASQGGPGGIPGVSRRVSSDRNWPGISEASKERFSLETSETLKWDQDVVRCCRYCGPFS